MDEEIGIEYINFKIHSKEVSRSSNKSIILLEPIVSEYIEDYHYDIRMIEKDFDVQEIDDDLHFVYEDDIKGFFQKHEESKVNDVPVRLMILNESLF